jgi:hypothetical protein
LAERYLSPQTYQFVNQLGVTRYIDASTGPDGPHGVTSYWLVPSGGYHNGTRFPHDVVEDLKGQSYDTRTIEGVEYYLVPEESSNLPGRLSHYAQLTGVAELQNPPSGGVNRVRETLEDTAEATVAPDAVEKYVEDNDAAEEARKKSSVEDERLARAVSESPAREPANAELVQGSPKGDSSSSSATPRGRKQDGEKQVKPTE